MGVRSKESHRLLDYQLHDFLELKLGQEKKKLVSKLKRKILKTPHFKGSNLYEFPAVGTPKACVVLSNGFSKNLKKVYLVGSDSSLKEFSCY